MSFAELNGFYAEILFCAVKFILLQDGYASMETTNYD